MERERERGGEDADTDDRDDDSGVLSVVPSLRSLFLACLCIIPAAAAGAAGVRCRTLGTLY